MKKLPIVALVVLLFALPYAFLLTPTAGAQDLSTLLNQAQQAGNEMLQRIRLGLTSTDLSTARAEARAAVTSGETWQTLLQQALSLAPNDATRSSIQAILVHVRDATRSASLAISGPDSEVRGRLDAARGEAEEALAELRPLVPPPALPKAGEPDVSTFSPLLAVLGAVMLLAGFGLRRLRLAIS